MNVSFKLHEDISKLPFWRAVACEVLGTLLLVFVGCGSAIVGNSADPTNNSADMVRISFTFGLVVMCLVWTLGPVSGCHLNPSISLGFFCIGRISLLRAAIYIVAQCIGAIVGSALLYGIAPEQKRGTLGATGLANGVGPGQGFGCEFIMTFMFLMTVCACVDEGRRDRSKNLSAIPLTIGFCLVFLCLMGIPYTGTSLNPARSLGPAIVANFWENHWVYWIGPLSGGCVGALVYHFCFSSALHADIVPQRAPAAAAVHPEIAPVPSHPPVFSRRSDAPMIAVNTTIRDDEEITTGGFRHIPFTTRHSDAPMVMMSEVNPS